MGVYIRGMEMPECCGYCPFEYKNYCMAKPSLRVEYADRHPRCPLIPVPPHGRLIDADALKWNYIRIRDDGIKEFSQYGIDRAPTVIEADYPPSVPLEQVWTELFGEDECKVCANADNEYCFACDNGNQFKPITQKEEDE